MSIFDFSCGECKVGFALEEELEKHLGELLSSPPQQVKADQNLHVEPEEEKQNVVPSKDLALSKGNLEVKDGKEPVQCNFIDDSYPSEDVLKNLLLLNGEKEKVAAIQCDKCSKAVVDENKLRAHIKSAHEEVRPFQCQDCQKSFQKHYPLLMHVRYVHDKVRSF